jgi:plasmid stabilization system protein ParE
MKRGRIYKTSASQRDLINIGVYLADFASPAIADRFLESVREDLDKLLAMPGMGAMRSFRYRGLKGVRSWPVTGFGSHLIFYRPSMRGITIIRIIHGSRDLPRAWRNR